VRREWEGGEISPGPTVISKSRRLCTSAVQGELEYFNNYPVRYILNVF